MSVVQWFGLRYDVVVLPVQRNMRHGGTGLTTRQAAVKI